DLIEEKRAEKKSLIKGEKSGKADLKMKIGRILEIQANYRCLVEIERSNFICQLSGRLKQVNFETRSLVAVGDFVNVDISENPRIEEILPRKNHISRFSEDSFQKEIIIASNIDQIIVTTSCKEPDINYSLIDRYICSAQIRNIKPVICINKIDLAENKKEIEKNIDFYKNFGYFVILTSAETGEGLEKLKHILKEKDSVFSGHSGVGKSSLINYLQPELDLKIGKVSEYSSKGVHTTTHSRLLAWNFGGFLIDTPGIRTFGLHKNDKDKIPAVFPGFSDLKENCEFNNCTHTHEQNCAVKKELAENRFPLKRYESYVRLWESL
nr:ribosome small subunit-dependent GTPase A [Candidatus Cloacimonadota bacterium]